MQDEIDEVEEGNADDLFERDMDEAIAGEANP